ncbi:unnamed protein product [Discosporangium mesarthrocarpum]
MVVLKSIIAGSLLLLLGMGLGASLVLAWLSRRTVDGPPPTGKPVEASTLPASRRCSFETSEASHGKWVPAKFGVDSSPVRGRSNNVPAWTRKCMELWRSPGSDLPPRPFSDMPYWEWEPDACKLDRFHQGKFCSAMAHRKGLLIVGEINGTPSVKAGKSYPCHESLCASPVMVVEQHCLHPLRSPPKRGEI